VKVNGTAVISIKEDRDIGKIYSVHTIDKVGSFEGNIEAVLIIYLVGEQGHTKKLKCLFPPGTAIEEISPPPPPPPSKELLEKLESDKALTSEEVLILFGEKVSVSSWRGIERFKVIAEASQPEGKVYYCEPV